LKVLCPFKTTLQPDNILFVQKEGYLLVQPTQMRMVRWRGLFLTLLRGSSG
jgi:hypothetical protein